MAKRSKDNPLDSAFQIDFDDDTFHIFRFAEKLPQRMKAIMKMYAFVAAKQLLDGLLQKLPKGERWAELRKALELVEVPGSGATYYAVRAKFRARRVKKVDVNRTVIYVRARKVLDRPKPEVQLLEDLGPWTPDSLPFWPTPKDAVVIQRQVSKREADKIAKQRGIDLPKVRREFDRIGFAVNTKKHIDEQPKRKGGRQKAIPDVAFEALSLEFGAPGIRPIPAWRVTLSDLKSFGLKQAHLKYRQLSRALTDPRDRSWGQWPLPQKRGKQSELKDYVPFQIRLGYG